jgi:hypothetical protein
MVRSHKFLFQDLGTIRQSHKALKYDIITTKETTEGKRHATLYQNGQQ